MNCFMVGKFVLQQQVRGAFSTIKMMILLPSSISSIVIPIQMNVFTLQSICFASEAGTFGNEKP